MKVRHEDGSQEGTYGWVDPNGVLRYLLTIKEFASLQQWLKRRKNSLISRKNLWSPIRGKICLPLRGCALPPLSLKLKIPSKLEVAPNALKMLDGVGEWMDGYPLDCYDY